MTGRQRVYDRMCTFGSLCTHTIGTLQGIHEQIEVRLIGLHFLAVPGHFHV